MLVNLRGGSLLYGQQSPADHLEHAETFRDSNQWDSAVLYFKAAADGYLALGDVPSSIKARIQLNNARIENLQYLVADTALSALLRQALALRDLDQIDLAHVYDTKGKLNMAMGSFEEAVGTLQLALSIKRNLGLNNDDMGQTHFRLGDAWRSMGVTDSAMHHYHRALDVRERTYGKKSVEAALVWSNIAIIHRINGAQDQALKVYLRSDSIIVDAIGPDHAQRASVLNGIAIIYAQTARYPEALHYFKQLLAIDEQNLAEDSPLLAKTYTNLGILHELMGDLKSAQDWHKKSLAIKLKSFAPDNPNLIVDYQGLGVIMNHIGDVDQALLYMRQVVDMELKAYDHMDPRLGTSYNMLATSLERKGEHEQALDYLRKAEEIFVNSGNALIELGPLYHSMALIYQQRELPDSATVLAGKALETNLAFQPDHPHVAGNYILIGNLEMAKGNYEAALEHYRKAVRINLQIYGEKHHDVALAYASMAKALAASGQVEEALQNVDLALLAATTTFSPSAQINNPLPSETILPRTVAAILGTKGNVLLGKHKQGGDAQDLQDALLTFSRAIEMIDAAQFSYRSKGSVANLRAEYDQIYEHALATAYQLYRDTDDATYLETAFDFSEKNKSALLVAALNETRAKDFAGVPKELLVEEQDLKRNLSYFEQQLIAAISDNDKSLISELQNKIFRQKNNYDDLVRRIEKEYPQYHQLKYTAESASVENIQEYLKNDDGLLVEYFMGEENIYVFIIGVDHSDFMEIDLGDDFTNLLAQFRSSLTNGQGDIGDFYSHSRAMYDLLVSPIAPLLSTQHITFVLDDELGYIPFEVLMSESGEAKTDAGHTYLFQDHAISYAYSATSLFQYQQVADQKQETRFLAMVPNFNSRNDEGEAEAPNLLAYQDVVRGGLIDLKGAQREVRSLSAFFAGDQFEQEDAQESVFKRLAPAYSILHLATHAIIDDVNPLNSRLLFTIDGDTIDDGNLYAWELFSMNLNADLAVLSACNTGFGKIQKGEGIQSLGRAFAYAGCPSRLMSLWPAQDASTADIMEYFYRYLSEGASKDVALQKAKVSFLEKADEFNRHPFYWAGFVLQGDPQPLVKRSWTWIYILAGVLLSFFIYYRVNKGRSVRKVA
ncbi:MAG: CHAT domain-containing protein [Saprospiraceae bacterium]|nr:CHAT domain-containing protein [Saprospiraceae bacterium]